VFAASLSGSSAERPSTPSKYVVAREASQYTKRVIQLDVDIGNAFSRWVHTAIDEFRVLRGLTMLQELLAERCAIRSDRTIVGFTLPFQAG
jgi:hypothetical protein